MGCFIIKYTIITYDHRNLALDVTDASSVSVKYKYDDGGNRIVKEVGSKNII